MTTDRLAILCTDDGLKTDDGMFMEVAFSTGITPRVLSVFYSAWSSL